MKKLTVALVASFAMLTGLSAFAASGQDALCNTNAETITAAPATEKIGLPCIKHDIDPKLFENFWDKWKMVSMHYRTDSGEMRVIYANPVAYDALINHKPYPDGAVFGKIAYPTTLDPLFPNSVMPQSQESMRVQIMVHDKRHPAAVDGWRYSLYGRGKLDGTMTKETIQACAVCHALAKSRDGIFALPMLNSRKVIDQLAAGKLNFADGFAPTSIDKLPQSIQAMIRQRGMALPILAKQHALFNGSVSEYTPASGRLAVAKNAVIVISDPAKTPVFLLAMPRQNGARCADVITGITRDSADKEQPAMQSAVICNRDSHL